MQSSQRLGSLCCLTMPRPYVFVMCEKVITDQAGVVSLIGLFHKITARPLAGADAPPPNAVIPKEWAIFTLWEVDPSEYGKKYQQAFQTVYPDGTNFGLETRVPITPEQGKRMLQCVALSTAMPISQNGLYTIKTWLEEDGKKIAEPTPISFEIELVRT